MSRRWWTALGAMGLVLTALAVARSSLWTYGADAGTFTQIVLDAFGGMRNGVEDGTHFRFHFSPTLVLLWPIAAAFHHLLALQLVQIAAYLAVPPLVVLFARPICGLAVAGRLGTLAMLYPPLLGVTFSEFHEVGLVPPLVLGMLVAAQRGRWWWFGACALLLAGVREDVDLELIVFGLTLAVIARVPGGAITPRAVRIAGLSAALGAGALLGTYAWVIIPALGGWRPAHFYTYPFADGPAALVRSAFTAPLRLAAAILTFGRLTYVLEALVPLALLPLRSRWTWLAVPGLAIVLLANEGLVWRMGTHYPAIWIPWLLAGAVLGCAQVMQRAGEAIALRWVTAAVAISVIVLVGFNPLHPLHYLKPNYHDLPAARRALACVPATAALSTHDEWFSAIAARYPRATVQRSGAVEYLVYAEDFDNALYRERLLPAVQAAVAAQTYHLICTAGRVHVYHHR